MTERSYLDPDVEIVAVICGHCCTPYNLAAAELEIMRRAVEVSGGNRTKAAELLGINVRTLRRRLNGGKR